MGKRVTILLVDDEPLLLMSMAADLQDAGFAVIEAANADQALAALNTIPSISLVCTDVRMPGSMDGIGLARRVRAERPELPVLLVSGEITGRHEPNIADARLIKPIDAAELLNTVRRLLAARAS